MPDLLEAWLPTFNTSLIVISGLFLTLGYFFIRRKQVLFHKRSMITAASFAGLFLVVYVVRYLLFEPKIFAGEGGLYVGHPAIVIGGQVLNVTGCAADRVEHELAPVYGGLSIITGSCLEIMEQIELHEIYQTGWNLISDAILVGIIGDTVGRRSLDAVPGTVQNHAGRGYYTLARDCRVVTYDARGHGASDAPDEVEAYTEEVFVEDLRQLLSGRKADGALLFTCNGRGIRMFGGPDHDAKVLDERVGVPAAGFFAAGEFGPVGGRNFVHGFTASVAVPLIRSRSSPAATSVFFASTTWTGLSSSRSSRYITWL